MIVMAGTYELTAKQATFLGNFDNIDGIINGLRGERPGRRHKK